MALGTAATLGVMGGAALLGGLAGASNNKSTQSQTSRVKLGEASGLENLGADVTEDQLKQLQNLVSAGPGQSAMEDANFANNQFAQMLQGGIDNGFVPGQSDISNANQFAQAMFSPQQTMLNQQFEDAQTQQARLAVQLGRPVNDPVLQNKLMQTQAREQQLLGSQQTAFAAQQAQNFMGQRFQGAQDLASLRSGLASQAMSNRSALLGLGSQIQQQGQNFRLNTAGRTTTGTNVQHANFGTVAGGALAGAGLGLGAVGKFGGLATGTTA